MATTKSAPKKPAGKRTDTALSTEEKAAMRETIRERKSPNGEPQVLAKIAEMVPADRVMAEKIHELVKKNAPELSAKTWYGMPAYADKGGNVVCFFQPAQKFKARYSTFGFSDKAKLDDGAMWPTSFAVTKLTPADEKKLVTLVKKAARGEND
jgi:uncharacterized protein YdhG (YjbR/CyaY superfamily)